MKNKKLFIFISMFLIALLMCFGYVMGHYSTDDYQIMNIGYHTYSIQKNLVEGRLFMFLIDQLFLKLNLSYITFIISTVVLAIFLSVLNILLLYELIKHYFKKNNSILIYMILFFTIFNFMYLENLYYVDSITMSLSLLFYTLSAKHFFTVGKKNIFLSLLFNILAFFCYNAFASYYIVLITILSLFKNRRINKNVLFDILKACLMIVISVLLNMIQISFCLKLFHLSNKRIQGSILTNLIIVLSNIPFILKNTCFLLPKYVFSFVMIVLLFSSFFYQKKNLLFVENLFLSCVCIFSCFVIPIFTTSSFGTGRIMFGMGMTIGIVLLNTLFHTSNKKEFYKMIVLFSIVWSIFNIFNYSYRTYLSKEKNEIDKKEVLQLEKMIKKYEKENNIVVDTLVCVQEKVNLNSSVIDRSALETEWSALGVITFYTERDLKQERIYEEEGNSYLKVMKDTYYFDKNRLIVKVYDW